MPDNMSIDIQAFLDQMKDMAIDGFVLGQIEKVDKSGVGVGLFKLLNKYGIHGDRAVSFISELGTVCGATGGTQNE